jgi:hypothetical protein
MKEVGHSLRFLRLPREHGAWAMLLVPYLTGFGAVRWSDYAAGRLAAGCLGILLLFIGRASMMQLIKPRYRGRTAGDQVKELWLNSILYGGLGAAIILGIIIIGGYWYLLAVGAAAFILFLGQTWLALRFGERSIPAELVGIVLLTLSAPLAAVLAGGAGVSDVILLWLINAMYFGASVFTVKMKVASKMERLEYFYFTTRLRIAAASIIYVLVAISLWLALAIFGVAPWLSPAAFLPVALYVLWSCITMSARLKIKTEGFVQLGLSLVFAFITITAWRIGG